MVITITSTNAVLRPSPYGRPPRLAYLPYGEAFDVLAEYEGYYVAGSNIWFEINYNNELGYVHISYTDLGGAPYEPSGINYPPISDANNLNLDLSRTARKWKVSQLYERVLHGSSALFLVEVGSKSLNYDLSVSLDNRDLKGNFFTHGLVEVDNYELWDNVKAYNMVFPLDIDPLFEVGSMVIESRGEALDLQYAVDKLGFFGEYKTSETQVLLPNTKYVIEVQNASGWTSNITINMTCYESEVTPIVQQLMLMAGSPNTPM